MVRTMGLKKTLRDSKERKKVSPSKQKDGHRSKKTKSFHKETVEEATSNQKETLEKVNQEISEEEAEKRDDEEVENDGEDGDDVNIDDDKEETEREEEDEESEESKEREDEESEKDGEDIQQGISDDEEEAEKGEDAEVEAEESEKDGEDIQQDISDDEEDSRALQPEKMYFSPSNYTKVIKIGTRCSVRQTVEFLEEFPAELKWFRAHEQFKHVFHMPKEANHMTQGMWMLMLHTTCTNVANESWFLVNGRLIRYSIREHALLTGLNCKNYPANWMKLGSLEFVKKVFGKTDIKVKDVQDKLERMKKKSSTDRKKLAVLYFLCKVLKAKSKHDGKIDSFLLSIVDDLSVCEKFPWGRYTFNDCMDGIKSLLKKMNGVVKEGAQPMFSGFIIPLEILAFECIPVLRMKFREDVEVDPGCPRMCKTKFGHGGLKGWSLDDINVALGENKDIISILQPTEGERGLLERIVEHDVEEGLGFVDPVVESWRERLLVQRKTIFWKGWYEVDVKARLSSSSRMIEGVDEKENSVEDPESIKAVLLKEMEKGFTVLMEALGNLDKKVVEKLTDLEVRVKVIQNHVANHGSGVIGSGGSPHTGFVLKVNPSVVTPVETTVASPVDITNDVDVVAQLLDMSNPMEKTDIEDGGEKKTVEKKDEKKKKRAISEDDVLEEERKRLKLEKIKKNLGEPEVIDTGVKRKRDKPLK